MEKPANTNPATAAAAAAAAAPSTTYVQAEAHTFRELVQRLTGAAAGEGLPTASQARTTPAVAPRRQPFKLQERRCPSVRTLEIQLGLTSLRSPRSPPPHLHHHLHHHHHPSSSGACSKSPFPSPVTPLGSDPLFSPASEEERAIAEKGFYLHPSPRGGGPPPELLPLFPLSSPRQRQPSTEEKKFP